MKYRRLSAQGPVVSAIGFGCMGLSGWYGQVEESAAVAIIQRAVAEGMTLFDTADMYGRGHNELLLGMALKGQRHRVVLSTKCGLQWEGDSVRLRNDPEYIMQACNASLQRLGTDYIDIYHLHRVDQEIPIEPALQAMLSLLHAGKIRYIGLSEVGPETLIKAQEILGDKLVCLQSEYSLVNHHDAEKVLPACRRAGIGFIAHAPLARGLLGGDLQRGTDFRQQPTWDVRILSQQFDQDALDANLNFVEALTSIAHAKNCTVAQLALAWALCRGEDVVPIPGMTHIEHLTENLYALEISLSPEDLAGIEEAQSTYPIRGERLI